MLRWFTIDELADLAVRADKCASLCSGITSEYYRTFATSADCLASLLQELDKTEIDQIPGVSEALSG